MSAKDLPDHTKQMTVVFGGGLVGLEELAARLGSIVPWDLQGNIVLMEDFETELTEWGTEIDGAGVTIALVTERKYSGDYSLRIGIPSGSGTSGWAYRSIYYPGLVKYCLFCRAGWADGMNKIELSMELYDGTYHYAIAIDYDALISTLRVYDDTGAYQEITDSLSLIPSDLTWFPLYVFFDLSTLKYDKVVIGSAEYDLSAYGIFREADGSTPHAVIKVKTIKTDTLAYVVYFDDIILAKNVP